MVGAAQSVDQRSKAIKSDKALWIWDQHCNAPDDIWSLVGRHMLVAIVLRIVPRCSVNSNLVKQRPGDKVCNSQPHCEMQQNISSHLSEVAQYVTGRRWQRVARSSRSFRPLSSPDGWWWHGGGEVKSGSSQGLLRIEVASNLSTRFNSA